MNKRNTIADKLLQTGAVLLRPNEPFTWASGWKSPIYCDNRKLLSFPYVRDFIKKELCSVITKRYAGVNLIAGVATAGIAWGAMAADQLKLPFVYVRPAPRQHGTGKQIEGNYKKGQQTVLVEDLVSTGKSSLKVVDVLRNEGLETMGMAAIFSYQFAHAEQAFADAHIPVYTLTDYTALISLGLENGRLHASDEEMLMQWRQDPANWKGLSV